MNYTPEYYDMKKILLNILLGIVAAISLSVTARASSGDLFVYPTPPDSMTQLMPRCNYIVSRFWDRCNFGTAFKDEAKLNRAFGDWVLIMPHAAADTVHASIDRLLARFAKKGPETLVLATLAENWLYSDTAEINSTEIYLPFARAAANHKKISKAERARFKSHVQIIESSSEGSTVPDIPFVNRDGSKSSFGSVTGTASILLFFNDPDCMDCNLARIRLSADPNTRELIERGELTVMSIYCGDTDDEGWEKAKANAPREWMCVAMPEADNYFDLRSTPLFVFLNSRHKVLLNNLGIDYLLGAFMAANLKAKGMQ